MYLVGADVYFAEVQTERIPGLKIVDTACLHPGCEPCTICPCLLRQAAIVFMIGRAGKRQRYGKPILNISGQCTVLCLYFVNYVVELELHEAPQIALFAQEEISSSFPSTWDPISS